MLGYQKTNTYLLCLVFVVLGIYYPTLFSPFNSVDDIGLYHYLLNTENFNLKSIFFPAGTGNYYRPVLWLSFIMDKFIWGLEESFMHLENIIFHLANTLLVYAVARRATQFLPEPSQVSPFVAALIFAIHPLNTEAVNWISGRTDLLAGFFLILAMYLMLNRPLGWVQSVMAAICMLLACLVKETAIFFLPAAVLFPFFIPASGAEAVPLNSVFRKYWLHLMVFSASGAVYFLFRMLAFSKGDKGVARVLSKVAVSESSSLLMNVRLVSKAAGFYAKKLLIPFPLNFCIVHVSDLYLPVGVLVFIGILWLFYRRTLPAFFVICAGAVGTSALMVPLLFYTWTPLAERYMYIPSAFFLVGATLAVQGWRQCSNYRLHLTLAVACITAIALYGTATRNILWQDNLALFQDTARKSPDFRPAQNELAYALEAIGKRKEAAVILKSYNEPSGINAQLGLQNKAVALINEGKYAEAGVILRQILANPGRHEVSILLRILELNKFMVVANKATLRDVYAESVKTLNRLIELTGDSFYSYRLGVINMQVGEKEKAIEAFKVVVKTAPPAIYYRKPAEKLVIELAK